MKPRLFEFLVRLVNQTKKQKDKFLKFFTLSTSVLFFGLLAGSLTGTWLDVPRSNGWWDGTIIVIFVVGSERITRRTQKQDKNTVLFVLQIGKRGMLRALFRDAFKVGS
jgi:hypothetical protein